MIKEYKQKYLEKLKTAALPTFKYGLNINIQPDIDKINPKITNNKKNKINLKYNKKKANITVVEELSESFLKKNKRIKEFFNNSWEDEDDSHKLFYYNEAFSKNYIIIEIKEKENIESPIIIDYNISEGATFSSILILSGKNSKSSLIINRNGKNCYFSESIKIIAEENSELELMVFQKFSQNSITFQKRKSVCKKNSTVLLKDFSIGAQYNKTNINSELIGDNSKTENIALFLTKDKEKYDLYTSSIHLGKNTNSNIITRGVIKDFSKALSRGLVKIEENAKNSNGYEKQDVLLLSEDAEADAIPNLEIKNNEVKCSHGSSIGQINKDQIFYLMSRGLNKEQATKKIIEGYFSKIISLIKDKNLINSIEKEIKNYIK